jgi:predicted transcriptional regulator
LSALPEYNSDDLAALEVGIVEGLADADEGHLSPEDAARAYLKAVRAKL